MVANGLDRFDIEHSADDHELLAQTEAKHTYAISSAQAPRSTSFERNWPDLGRLFYMLRFRTSISLRILGAFFVIWILVTLSRWFGNGTNIHVPTSLFSKGSVHASNYPFSGAFARFPKISALSAEQRRITVVGVWNDDSFPVLLRHFFYTIQLNADSIDLLMLNRVFTPGGKCLDFEKAGVDIHWGGNIKVHCIDNDEWRKRHVDFLCSEEYGWACDPTEYEDVTKEFLQRSDEKNYNWRPFRGYVFRDLIADPNAAFWAWLDHDIFVGNFARYPFNVLSQVSLVSGSQDQANSVYMAGQLTAFNFNDPALGTAWKKFPGLKSPAHFTKYVEERMPESSEERYWSYGYLRSEEHLPGSELSFCLYPDMHGDDYYEGHWNFRNSHETYVISGRDILLVSSKYTRKEIEDVVHLERHTPIDELGGIGWTTGEDGSGVLLEQPDLTPEEAVSIALEQGGARAAAAPIFNGVVEDHILPGNCSDKPWRQCVRNHPMMLTKPPIYRSSLVHFKEQQPDHVFRRLERDVRPRGYERKLIKHHLKSKTQEWFDLPNFDITEDMVLRYNMDSIEVFKMGADRDKTLFYRKEGAESIG